MVLTYDAEFWEPPLISDRLCDCFLTSDYEFWDFPTISIDEPYGLRRRSYVLEFELIGLPDRMRAFPFCSVAAK
jgi:hypothetical protein